MRTFLRVFQYSFDRHIAGGPLIKLLNYCRLLISRQILGRRFESRLVIYYRQGEPNELSVLAEKYGSDKGSIENGLQPFSWVPHTYTDYYDKILGPRRKNVARVFECGIGTDNILINSTMGPKGRPGASLRMWRDYFPSAKVLGVDIDKGILFEEERIETQYLDQTNPLLVASLWSKYSDVSFDLMIDDGLHTFEAGKTLFEGSINRLTLDGFYVIEDVAPKDRLKYMYFFSALRYSVEFIDLYRPKVWLGDNSMIVVRKHR